MPIHLGQISATSQHSVALAYNLGYVGQNGFTAPFLLESMGVVKHILLIVFLFDTKEWIYSAPFFVGIQAIACNYFRSFYLLFISMNTQRRQRCFPVTDTLAKSLKVIRYKGSTQSGTEA